VLSDPTKVIGFDTGAVNPTFKIVGNKLHIIETHGLETAYHIEYLTANGDSTNFLGAGNTVQVNGTATSSLAIPALLEPATGKKGIVILNSISAAAGSDYRVEHKGFSRLVIDLDAGVVSGAVAAQQGESGNNTITYGFHNYPLVDLRNGPSGTSSVLTSTANVVGDTTGMGSVKDNPTLYIDASGQLVINRATQHAAAYTSMYTAEFYQRTGYSSIASFVSVSSDDTLFNTGGGVDTDGGPINELHFDVPASAHVGIVQMSWNTIGGNDTNENIGMGFAVVDLAAGTSAGSITFIRASTPDLVSWDAVPLGTVFFGATDAAGNPLYQSNKNAGSFTDRYGETAQFVLVNNADGSRTLVFLAENGGGTQKFRQYQGNAQISWLGNEPFQISGLPPAGSLSAGSPVPGGGWEIDFADLPTLEYIPEDHASDQVDLEFGLSSTGEVEKITVYIEPVVDPVSVSAADAVGYISTPIPLSISSGSTIDVDGSETEPDPLTLTGVPASVVLSSSAGTVANPSAGTWTLSQSALAGLSATSPTAATATVTVSGLQTDEADLDADGVIELTPWSRT